MSTWGVINGFDNQVKAMNACFSNMLWELQKDEREAKEAVELAERLEREAEERRIKLLTKRRDDLLRGNPFKLSTKDRARNRIPSIQYSSS